MGFLGNSRKPKPFGFIPRFYDEQKEERDKRLKALAASVGLDPVGAVLLPAAVWARGLTG